MLLLVKNAGNAFFIWGRTSICSCYKGYINEMLCLFELLVNTVVKISRKEKVILTIVSHRTQKWLLDQKMPTIAFYPKSEILDRCAFAYCKIGTRRSIATSYKEKLSPQMFSTLKNFYFLKSTKNIRFYPNYRMLNSNTYASSRIKIRSFDSTINKRNESLHTLYSKKKYFYHKNTKIQICTWINKDQNDKFKSNQKQK